VDLHALRGAVVDGPLSWPVLSSTQAGLRTVERLDRLFSSTQSTAAFSRIEMKPNNSNNLLREVWIVGELAGAC
jgi:hypothetical protein